jgi:hypothetical protein
VHADRISCTDGAKFVSSGPGARGAFSPHQPSHFGWIARAGVRKKTDSKGL